MRLMPNKIDLACCICHPGESAIGAIEKCLDNGLGVCFAVDEAGKFIGRIDLECLRRALREGRLSIDGCLRELILRPPGLSGTDAEDWLRPILDNSGRIVDVAVDRSRRPVPLARPDLSSVEFRLTLDAFLSSWISSRGEYVSQFQNAFAALVGRRHGVAVCNGTAALHLALTALGVGPGGPQSPRHNPQPDRSRALARATSGPNLPTSDAVDLNVIRKLKDVLWQVIGRRAA